MQESNPTLHKKIIVVVSSMGFDWSNNSISNVGVIGFVFFVRYVIVIRFRHGCSTRLLNYSSITTNAFNVRSSPVCEIVRSVLYIHLIHSYDKHGK
uniref:Uncharacterized protein n=1 Tax=Oryza sativa subsp. japonica TaxID=39947 RepID=Q69LI2_ORYSJ|nr:hypothetical protein [Oryza sativa Japonica Group]